MNERGSGLTTTFTNDDRLSVSPPISHILGNKFKAAAAIGVSDLDPPNVTDERELTSSLVLERRVTNSSVSQTEKETQSSVD
jgi:hypothetical protein